MAEVLLVNPCLGDEKVWGELEEAGSVLPPYGLALLAAVLRKNKVSVKILDAQALKLDYKETVNRILKENPKFLGLTATTSLIENAAEIARLVKAENKKIIILIGGAHISAIPKECMKEFPDFDVGIVGEGEESIVEIVKSKSLSKIKGLVYRNKGKIILNQARELIKELDKLPMPAWDLLPDLNKYYRAAVTNYKRLPSTSLITSRGCAGQCVFCAKDIFGKFCRFHSAEYVVKMIEYLRKRYGIKDISFYDDNFLLSRKRVIDFCNLVIKKKIDITWCCDTRIDIVNKEILKLMKKAGCWQVVYGIESGSQKILDNLHKNITLKQIEDAVKWSKDAGLEVRAFFIIGNPGETKETILETINFMKKLPLDDFFLSYFTIFPGSPISRIAEKYGKVRQGYKYKDKININFIPNGLTEQELRKYYKKAFREFYLRPRQIMKYAWKMRDVKNIKSLLVLAFNPLPFK